MYSFVLMSALATGGDTPSSGWGVGCQGSSCSGIVASGCSGYAAPVGCSGYAAPVGCSGFSAPAGCGGCGGRSLFPLFPNLRARLAGRFSGSGCGGCGGCTGYVASSCYGSACYGSSCHGSASYGSACYGSTSFGSACYGSSSYAAPAFGGSCLGSTTYFAPSYSSGYSLGSSFGGCIGSSAVVPSCYGSSYSPAYLSGVPVVAPQVVMPSVVPLSKTDARPEYQVSKATPTADAPARLTVELPADAVLFVDGEKVAGTGPSRNFHTPALPDGTFYYELKAEVKVDGEMVTESLKVLVKAGDAKTESFGKLLAAVKAAKNPALVSK